MGEEVTEDLKKYSFEFEWAIFVPAAFLYVNGCFSGEACFGFTFKHAARRAIKAYKRQRVQATDLFGGEQ